MYIAYVNYRTYFVGSIIYSTSLQVPLSSGSVPHSFLSGRWRGDAVRLQGAKDHPTATAERAQDLCPVPQVVEVVLIKRWSIWMFILENYETACRLMFDEGNTCFAAFIDGTFYMIM